MNLSIDQSVLEPPTIGSQSCQASDCQCRKMFQRLDQICELQWQSEPRLVWLLRAGSFCTDWSNLWAIGPNYELYRYLPTRNMKYKGILFLPVLILRVIFGPFWVLMTLSRPLSHLSSSTQDPYTLSRLNHPSTEYSYTLFMRIVSIQYKRLLKHLIWGKWK